MLHMVEREVGCYRETLCGERGVIQGDLISTNIFYVVVDTVVRHWESLVVEGGGGDDKDNSSGDESVNPER